MHPKQHCKLGPSCQICIANKDAQVHADFQAHVLSGKNVLSIPRSLFYEFLTSHWKINKESNAAILMTAELQLKTILQNYSFNGILY